MPLISCCGFVTRKCSIMMGKSSLWAISFWSWPCIRPCRSDFFPETMRPSCLQTSRRSALTISRSLAVISACMAAIDRGPAMVTTSSASRNLQSQEDFVGMRSPLGDEVERTGDAQSL